ncbi:MAG TPA: alpha-L-fucosidase [Bacteroidota bacterium]|nr:alpha-L-fucosidase [Bacteroidota bacterium]
MRPSFLRVPDVRRLLMAFCAVFSLSPDLQAQLRGQDGGRRMRVACIGNSITAGVGVSDPQRFSYPSQLQALLGHGWDVRNFGVSGRTLLGRGDFPYRREPEYAAAQAFKPDVVIIKLGTNDSKPQNWVHRADFIRDYGDFLKPFLHAAAVPRIYLCTPVPAFPGDWGISDSIIRSEIVPLVHQVARDSHVEVIDLYAALTGKPDYFPDKVHPGLDGARAIAWAVYHALAADFRLTPVPEPVPPLPSVRQLVWQENDYAAFVHFNMNTFTDSEWGSGEESPSLWNPARFDAGAIVRAIRDAGMKSLILTCKHHDGFCLWQTATTPHSVAGSPWKNGKGDVVREFADECRKEGIRFGIYLSPWDRNSALYGTPAYIGLYRQQLRELLTGYGPIAEVWFDGANGGDGFYGGARGTRTIDRTSYYQWEDTWNMVRNLQPEAVIFSDVGPDVRWVGNEDGFASDTCWSPYSPVGEKGDTPAPGYVRSEEGMTGQRDGARWMPPECDVSIRPGWFYHAREDSLVKSPAQLFDIFCKSAGRNGTLLLNVPPDRDGRIAAPDRASLSGLKKILDGTFGRNLITGVESVSNIRGNDARFGAANLLNDTSGDYWATDDSVLTASVIFSVDSASDVDCLQLREYTALGQRVEQFAAEIPDGEHGWKTLCTGTTVGHRRILRFPPVRTNRLRLTILRAKACPVLSGAGLYATPGGLH